MAEEQSLSRILISPSLRDVLRLAAVFLHSLHVGPEGASLGEALEEACEEARREVGGRRPLDLEPVARIRRLWKRVGIDPTKERPASERLLRNALRGRRPLSADGFAGAMNLVSLRRQFPLSFHDWDRLKPPVLVRIGGTGDRCRDSAGREIILQGKIALADGEGAIGGLGGDSERTRVAPGTSRALVLAFAPADTPRAALEEVVEAIAAAAQEHCGGSVAASGIMP